MENIEEAQSKSVKDALMMSAVGLLFFVAVGTPCLKLDIDPKIPHLPGFGDLFLLPKLRHSENFINFY